MENSFFTAHSKEFETVEAGYPFPTKAVGCAEEILAFTRNKIGWVFGSLLRVKMPSGCSLYLHVGSN